MSKTNTAVQPQYRYCRKKQGYCTTANWHGECSITACNKERLYRKVYGNTAKQVIIDETLERMGNKERGRGEWINNPDDTAGEGYFICSACNRDFYDVHNFCPNCGADMRGSDNE